MASGRLPIVRIDKDGTTTDGTAAWTYDHIHDFRDLDGNELPLPAGSRYEVPFTTNEEGKPVYGRD